MKLFINIILLISLVSCSTSKKINREENYSSNFYQSSGKEKYFLPLGPLWSHHSQSGQCLLKSTVNYLDLKNVISSYDLSYSNAILLQASYNDLSRKYENLNSEQIELVFKDALAKVKNNLVNVVSVDYHRVHIIWIDEIINNKNKVEKLKVLLNIDPLRKGVPIVLSMCHSKSELRYILKELGLLSQFRGFITSEFFTPFTSDNLSLNSMQLDLEKLIEGKKNIEVYVPSGLFPTELKGKFKYKRIKWEEK